jgi:methylmalonyl-CoA mutase cobalamin-binding subunit
MPAEDIVNAVEDRKASALALSIVYPADDPQLTDQLRKIRQTAPDRIPILVGGRSAKAYEKVLDEIGAIRIGGLTHLRRELDRLKQKADSSSLSQGSMKKGRV